MKKIEINTTQNVLIEYTLAPISDRILAFIIDLLIVGLSSGLLLGIYSLFFVGGREIAGALFFTIPLLTYNLISEIITNGQSIGKKALKIKVIKLNGEKPNGFDFMMRWVFRLVDILFSMGILAIFMITSSTRSQRIGDMLSDMVMIKSNPTDYFSTEWIKARENKTNYQPQYPEIKQFSEEEMLLIKKVIDRYSAFKNRGHEDAVNNLVDKVEEQLGIKCKGNKIEFLNQLIKDYVFLTR